MNHDYWGPPSEEEIKEEKLEKEYKNKLSVLLNRNAGYFKVNELIQLFEFCNKSSFGTKEYQRNRIDEIDFLSRNRDLGES